MKTQELETEAIKALFFDANAIRFAPRQLYRINHYSAGRYYYGFTKEGEPEFYVSVTNFIQATLPTPPHLINWIASQGVEQAEKYKIERAGYGSFMHGLFQTLLIERRLDLSKVQEDLASYLESERLPVHYAAEWQHELKKDVAAFAQFIRDYNVRPLMIEQVLASRDGYAGALDLVCYMDVETNGFHATDVFKTGPRAGQPKPCKHVETIVAIVDFKSGRKGFYETHEIQLEAYRRLLAENFPDIPVTRVYNFSPKDWKGSVPSYNLKDQTDSANIEKFDYLVELSKVESKKREKMITNVSGILDLDEDVSNCVEYLTLSDLVKSRNR